MKHLLNNLSEQEKNNIREQHSGGIKINTDKFIRLVESKLGDVKPLISEQTNPEIIDSIKQMGFDKKNCDNYDPKADKLIFQYCHMKNPKLEILYRDNGLELLDLVNQEILGSWETFGPDDIIDLEAAVKGAFSVEDEF